MSITIKEIADKLQVSTATVSRSLRNDLLVHPETRARVNQMAVALGYQGRAGRGPSRRAGVHGRGAAQPDVRRPLIGIVLALRHVAQARQHGIYGHMLQGITAECDTQCVRNSLFMAPWTGGRLPAGEVDRLADKVAESQCDAVVVVGALPEEFIEALCRRLPVVVLSRRFDSLHADSALQDNVAAIAGLVGRLAALAHRRLAFVDDCNVSSMYLERYAGFVMGCEQFGIGVSDRHRVRTEDYIETAAGMRLDNNLIRRLIAEQNVTGFVCVNDKVALECLTAVEGFELAVPEHVSVTGFDNDRSNVSTETIGLVNLCTIDPNFIELGRCAVRLAVQRITFPATPPLRLSVAAAIIDGATTGPPRISLPEGFLATGSR
ncbi:MAG: LacI family DNA-binding transcriptional regulator [Capsulimonadaceae bacterium]|nr:LacI family DNA-binding transcriptional regulator [Capsulimonadaceae bacterium]